MKKSIPILLVLALLVIVSLISFPITDRGSAPADDAQRASAELPAKQGHGPSDWRAPASRQEGQKPANVSPPSWRPPGTFAIAGKPAPAIVFPRGENASRRYHKVVSRDIDPEHSPTIPAVLAKSPEDGRFDLLPEEIDAHTLVSGRMVFDPTALDRILHGTTSRLLAPTLTEEVLTLEFQKIKTRSANTHTLQGHVAGEEATSLVQVVYHDGILHGTVMRYDKNEEIEYRILADGHMMVRQLDHSTMTAGCSTCSGEIMADLVDEGFDEGSEKTDSESEPQDPLSNDTAGWRTIDVTVGYTVEARLADGGNSQIEARIIASVDRMTLAFANSAIANTELILLGTIEDPDFVEHTSTRVFDAHSKLRNETDGYLDVVTDFHHQLGSDLASIIVSSTQTGGVAGVATSGSWSSANARSQMTSSQMTFEHELGHNLGCAHAWGDTSEGNTESNMGWRFKGTSGTAYSTIMAYTAGWGGRVPYYSNPNVLHPDGNVPTGCVDGYSATSDPTVDPALKPGYDGSVPTRGANNASTIDTGEGNVTYGATVASNRATRTDFEVHAPAAAAQWEKGTTRTISFSGGDMDDLATIHLYKGGVLHATLAPNVNPATHRNFAWEIPFSLTDGSDYMIRIELNRNGSTLVADSGLFEIFSDLPHVNTASAPAVPAVIGQVSSLILTFNVPMNPATFDVGTDIVSFINPEGSSLLGSITGTSWSAGDTVLTIQFTPPSLQGSYQMAIGPDIEDTAGNKIDQDCDGTTGESIEDRYTATFHVNPPLIRYDNMDTNPGWTFSANNPVNGWAWGKPTGGTGYSQYGIVDPSSGYNGANVIGYNLTGDYERGITSTRWATTPAMDCSSYENVRLRFQRWLGVYYGSTVYGGSTGDNAYIEVSNNGTTWTPVWHNTNSRLTTAAWVEVEYDISAVADGQSTVYVRWGMGTSNSSLNDDSCGWNIDEVIVHGDYVDNSDNNPPYPSPMSFASAPTAQGVSAVTMTATTALDANGVEYYFDETSGSPGGTDSGWQDSPTYTDSGLQAGTQYTYTVKARDKSPGQNETGASAPASATTDAGPKLTLTIIAASIGESDGPGATTATVTRNTATTSSLVVNLSSSDTTEVTVPASVTIAAGQSTSPVFNVNAVDDAIIDGTQSVTLTATATGHANGSDTIDVTDDLPLTLTVVTGTNGDSTSGGGLKDPDGSPFAITATPASGFRFGQWTVISGDATFGNENNASTTVETTGDVTVQANFMVGTYTVTYLGNGSDGGSVPVDALSPYDYNSNVTVLGNTGALTRTGYSFAGWNTASGGSGTSYVEGNTFNIATDTTLYAKWNSPPIVDAGADQTIYLSGTAPWSPASMTTSVSAWFDATDTESVTLNSGKVSLWEDKTGKGNHMAQGNASLQPAYNASDSRMNGMPTIGYDLALKHLTSSTAFTVKRVYLTTYYEGNTFDSWLILFADPVDQLPRVGGHSGQSYFQDNGTSTAYRNGSETTNFAGGVPVLPMGPTMWEFTLDSADTNTWRLLAASSSWTGWQNGAIGEVIMTDGTESEEDSQKIEGYLAHKWGTAASLSADHPYKDAAPGSPPAVATLNAMVNDMDGDPLTLQWTKADGPAFAVNFANPGAADTTASFTGPGSYTLRLTADDGLHQSYDEVVITVSLSSANVFASWMAGYDVGGQTALGDDYDQDGLTNLQEFAFGTNPTAGQPGRIRIDPNGNLVSAGLPHIVNLSVPPAVPDFRAVFARRKDHEVAGLTYTVYFSADLNRWTAINVGLQVQPDVTQDDVEAVTVPFPASVPVADTEAPEQAPGFFRIFVTLD